MISKIRKLLIVASFFLIFADYGFAQKGTTKNTSKGSVSNSASSTEKKNSSQIDKQAAESAMRSNQPEAAGEYYKYVVYVNPSDQIAYHLLQTLPQEYKGIKIEPLSAANWYYVGGNSSNMSSFKRALGGYFTIFPQDEIDNLMDLLPCLAEVKSVVLDLDRKLFKQ